MDYIFSFLENVPSELATMFLAAVPITEIRASIPIAFNMYQMPIISAVFWSVAGNMIMALILIVLIDPISKFLGRNFNFFDKLFKWFFERTRKRFYNKYSKYGDLGLILFVAVPLPTTGCWSGAVAAWLFGIEPRKSFMLIFIGILISAFIVSLITIGAGQIV